MIKLKKACGAVVTVNQSNCDKDRLLVEDSSSSESYSILSSHLEKLKTYKTARGLLAYVKKNADNVNLLESDSHSEDTSNENVESSSDSNPFCELSLNPANSQTYSKQTRVFLDFQTIKNTKEKTEIIALAIVDASGRTLYNSLFKPSRVLKPSERQEFGTRSKALQNAPSFALQYRKIQKVIEGKTLYIWDGYNKNQIARAIATAFEYNERLDLHDIWRNLVFHLSDEYYYRLGRSPQKTYVRGATLADACEQEGIEIVSDRLDCLNRAKRLAQIYQRMQNRMAECA